MATSVARGGAGFLPVLEDFNSVIVHTQMCFLQT